MYESAGSTTSQNNFRVSVFYNFSSGFRASGVPGSPDFPPLAERQRRIRREKGLTLMQVSKVLGYRNAGYVSDTELGRFVTHPDKLAKWAEALGMTQEEMDSRSERKPLTDVQDRTKLSITLSKT